MRRLAESSSTGSVAARADAGRNVVGEDLMTRLPKTVSGPASKAPFWLICRHFTITPGVVRGGLCAIVLQTHPPPRTEV